MIAIVLLVILFPLALALAAFCAGCETGFLSVSRGRVLHLAHAGSAAAKILETALADMARTTTALLVGNNLASVVYSTVSAALAARIFCGDVAAQTAWGFVAAGGMLYFGEFLPKLFASTRPLRRLVRVARAWRVFETVLRPLTVTALAVTGIFLPRRGKPAPHALTPDEMLRVLQDRKDGVRLTDIESALIGRILVLRATGRAVTPEAILTALDAP